ncbi:MAG: hypothetical protein ACTSP7_14000 [Candidatus Heimdallarchaeota archaeon]
MSDDFDLDPQARSKQDDIARKVAIVKMLRRKKFSSDEKISLPINSIFNVFLKQ